jgi:hypothetical protein
MYLAKVVYFVAKIGFLYEPTAAPAVPSVALAEHTPEARTQK